MCSPICIAKFDNSVTFYARTVRKWTMILWDAAVASSTELESRTRRYDSSISMVSKRVKVYSATEA